MDANKDTERYRIALPSMHPRESSKGQKFKGAGFSIAHFDSKSHEDFKREISQKPINMTAVNFKIDSIIEPY